MHISKAFWTTLLQKRAKRKRYRLVKNLRPVPTIFDTEESHLLAGIQIFKVTGIRS